MQVHGYQDTALGEIPRDWDVCVLGDLATIQTGYPFSSAFFTDDGEETQYKIIRIRNISSLKTETYYAGDLDNEIIHEYLVTDGNILIGMDGKFHIARWKGQKGLLNQRVARLREFRSRLLEDFAYFAIIAPIKKIEESKHYTTVKHLSMKDLRRLSIHLPPLPEQRGIAHVLSSVRRAIEATEQVIDAAKELKRSMMKHLFTYGPVPVDKSDQVVLMETEIGEVPEGWEVMKVDDFAEIKTGGTPLRTKSEFWNGNIPWVKTGEINYNTITVTEESITEKGYQNSSAKMIPAGTLLMAMYGQGVTRGRVAILGIDASLNQACAAFILQRKISNKYLYYYFTQNYENIRNMGHGAHQKNLSATLIKSIKVAIPDSQHQKDISRLLSIIDKKISVEIQYKSTLEDFFDSLLHHLMTGKVRVPYEEGGEE